MLTSKIRCSSCSNNKQNVQSQSTLFFDILMFIQLIIKNFIDKQTTVNIF
jgi:hypothetical protein